MKMLSKYILRPFILFDTVFNTELLAPGKDTDEPEHMKHEDGSDGTFTIGEAPDQMLMPSIDLIIERHAALSDLNGSEKIDLVGKAGIDAERQIATHIEQPVRCKLWRIIKNRRTT